MNRTRKIYGIYLFSAPNLQGGNQIIDLQIGQMITKRKISEIPITYVVINDVLKMA